MMTDRSEARVEVAAKALCEVLELPEFMATDVRDAEWLRRDALLILAAADDCDRAAGVVRVDTNDDGMAALIAAVLLDVVYGWNPAHEVPSNEAHESSMLAARAVLSQFAALAAAGAQPEQEDHHYWDRGGQRSRHPGPVAQCDYCAVVDLPAGALPPPEEETQQHG